MRTDIVFFGLLLAAEAVIFHGHFAHYISWYPPEFYDQAVYLSAAYELQNAMSQKGLWAIWLALRDSAHANGLLLPIEGGTLGALLGGARLPALMVNFVAFGVGQIAAFLAVRHVTQSRAFAYAAVGLVLLAQTTWNAIGGLLDFRIDFAALCLYGTWVALILRSSMFLSARWSVLVGLVGGILLLHRFVALVYLVGVSLGFLGLLVVWAWKRKFEFRTRVQNVAMSSAITLAIFLPFFLSRIREFTAYYALTGEDPETRASMAGVFTNIDNLIFYPRAIANGHVGWAFIYAAAGLILTSLVARIFVARSRSGWPDLPVMILFLLGAIAWPIIALTLHPSKASQTAGIVCIPIALLVVLSAHVLAPTLPRFSRAAAVLLIIAGVLFQSNRAVFEAEAVTIKGRADLTEWADMVQWLNRYAIEKGLRSPILSVDLISSEINGPALISGGYELTGAFVNWRQLLAANILSIDRDQIMEWAGQSDVLILTSLPKPPGYPFHASITPNLPALAGWAEDHMRLAKVFTFKEGNARIYVKP
jgi:hypothetical protein